MKFLKIPHAWLLFAPYISFGLGFLCNAIVCAANGGQMPVEWPGGCAAFAKAQADAADLGVNDAIHTCMTKASHLKFLADWIGINGVGIASPGDFLLWGGSIAAGYAFVIWLAWIIRDYNTRGEGAAS